MRLLLAFILLLGAPPAARTAGADPAPDLTEVSWSDGKVAIRWTDRSTDEDRFRVARINWTTRVVNNIYDIPTRNKVGTGESYMVLDLDPVTPTKAGEICYKIQAHDSPDFKVGWVSNERCLSVPRTTQTQKPPTRTTAPGPSKTRAPRSPAPEPTATADSAAPAPPGAGPSPSTSTSPGFTAAPAASVDTPRTGGLGWVPIAGAAVLAAGLLAIAGVWSRRRRRSAA